MTTNTDQNMTTDNATENNNNTMTDNTQTETVTATDETPNMETTHMNLDTLNQIRNLVSDILKQFKTEGLNFQEIAPELYKKLGGLYWLCTPHKAENGKHNNGRLFFIGTKNLGYTKSGDDPCLWAWLNCHDVVNVSFTVGAQEDGSLLPYTGRFFTRRDADKKVQELLRSRESFRALSAHEALQAVMLFSTKKAQQPLMEAMLQLCELTENDENGGLTGAKALIVHKETENVVAKFGVRPFVFPAVVDLVDPTTMHVTTLQKTANGSSVPVGGPTIWEFYGNSLEDAPVMEEESAEALSDEDQQAFANC